MFSVDGYRALTTGVGFVVRPDRGVIQVSGAERASWLQGLLTNDVLSLPPGHARYAAYLTPQGRMISDMRVVASGDSLLLDVPATIATSLRDRLDSLVFAEDVHLVDASGAISILEIHGPNGREPLRQREDDLASLGAIVARDEHSGVPGWVLYVGGEQESSLRRLLEAEGVPEVPLETLEVVRIEAGRPKFLVDMNEDTIPLEAGLEDRAISFTKGCYVGQEIIVRVMQRGGGRVAKRLVGLAFEDRDAAHPGEPVLSGNREIGRITSAAWSPALERPIALGYVHRDFVVPGTPVLVGRERPLRAVVAALPFVAPVALS